MGARYARRDRERPERSLAQVGRQHPLPDRHLGNHLIDEDRSALGHAPRNARGAKPAPLAGERHQLLVRAVNAAHAQKSVRQNPAFEKALELVPDERGQARAGPRFDLSEERLQMLPHQPMQERLLGPPPLVLDRVRRRGAQRWFALRFHPVPSGCKRANHDRGAPRPGR